MEDNSLNKQEIIEDSKIDNIKDFYLTKYQEMYEEILSNRIELINKELFKLDEEIEKLNLSMKKIDEDLEYNQQHVQMIEDIEEKIYNCYAVIEEKRFTMETQLDQIQTETIETFKKHRDIVLHWFDNLYEFMNNNLSTEELHTAIRNLTFKLFNEGYDYAILIKQNEQRTYQLQDSLEEESAQTRKTLDSLLKEKQRYEKTMASTTEENKENLTNDLQNSIEHKKTYLSEIKKAYDVTSRKQLKELNDLCIKFSLINKDPKEQIEELDALLNRYQTTLIGLDTLSNQKYLSKKRLNSLKEEKNRLDQIKLKKEKLDKKINTLQNVYLIISKNIKEMDEYLEQVKKRIASFKHQQFLRFDEQFQKDIVNSKKVIKQQQLLIENLHEERTYILFDPTEEKIKNIDNQIHQEELHLNSLIKNLNELEKDYNTFLQQNDNNTIKKLLEIGNFYEQNLPKIKDLTLQLKEKINTQTDKSLALQNELVEYQNILTQIQELQNEDYD